MLGQDFEPARTVKTLALLIGEFPMKRTSEEAADVRFANLMDVLREEKLPPWAIDRAARKWQRGHYGPKEFAPTSAELCVHARDEVLMVRGELRALRRLETAPVMQDDPQPVTAEAVDRILTATGWPDLAKRRQERRTPRLRCPDCEGGGAVAADTEAGAVLCTACQGSGLQPLPALPATSALDGASPSMP